MNSESADKQDADSETQNLTTAVNDKVFKNDATTFKLCSRHTLNNSEEIDKREREYYKNIPHWNGYKKIENVDARVWEIDKKLEAECNPVIGRIGKNAS